MEKKSQGQPDEAPQSVNPADALRHYEIRITIYINLLKNFQNRKELNDKLLQGYIGELNEIAVEISNLKMALSKTESRRFNNLLRHINAVIRKFGSDSGRR